MNAISGASAAYAAPAVAATTSSQPTSPATTVGNGSGPAVILSLSNTSAAKPDMAQGDPDGDGK